MAALQRQRTSEPVARWMALNLEEREGGWGWRVVRTEMEALLRDYFRRDLWNVVEDPPSAVELHVVKAQESSVLDEAACSRIERAAARTGRVHLHRLAGGHWVHADNPDALVALLADGLA